jgi:hypothetical protein
LKIAGPHYARDRAQTQTNSLQRHDKCLARSAGTPARPLVSPRRFRDNRYSDPGSTSATHSNETSRTTPRPPAVAGRTCDWLIATPPAWCALPFAAAEGGVPTLAPMLEKLTPGGLQLNIRRGDLSLLLSMQ